MQRIKLFREINFALSEDSIYDVVHPPRYNSSNELDQDENVSLVEVKCSGTPEKHHHQVLIKKS